MSYPRNAASPPGVIVGSIYLIADGTIQTTGASVRVQTGTGAWGAGAGTLACDTTSGVWKYTPTQGETDATDFHVAVYKASSTTAGVSVVTSASATAGYAGTDHSKIANPTSTVNLSGTTIKTATDVETKAADIQSRLPAALNGGKMDSVVPDTQKVDVNTIKTQSVTCSAGVTVSPYVGSTGAAINGTNINTLYSDWADGGRLDLILDSRSSHTAIEAADALLVRDVDQVEATAPVDSLCYVVLASRYSARSGSTLTVYRTDGSTPFSTRTLTTTTSATYIIGINT